MIAPYLDQIAATRSQERRRWPRSTWTRTAICRARFGIRSIPDARRVQGRPRGGSNHRGPPQGSDPQPAAEAHRLGQSEDSRDRARARSSHPPEPPRRSSRRVGQRGMGSGRTTISRRATTSSPRSRSWFPGTFSDQGHRRHPSSGSRPRTSQQRHTGISLRAALENRRAIAPHRAVVVHRCHPQERGERTAERHTAAGPHDATRLDEPPSPEARTEPRPAAGRRLVARPSPIASTACFTTSMPTRPETCSSCRRSENPGSVISMRASSFARRTASSGVNRPRSMAALQPGGGGRACDPSVLDADRESGGVPPDARCSGGPPPWFAARRAGGQPVIEGVPTCAWRRDRWAARSGCDRCGRRRPGRRTSPASPSLRERHRPRPASSL